MGLELATSLPLEHILLLVIGGFGAGLIDAIVGGGGLITVPIFLLILGPNASAIGTNKIAAVAAQFTALIVYFRNGQVHATRGFPIFAVTAFGAILGALAAPSMPPEFFKWFLLVVAPIVLSMVFLKGAWERPLGATQRPRLALLGNFGAGIYDGIAGPGGGTFMFLSLFMLGGMPAGIAMGTGKFANFGSAVTSLITYAAQGEVRWAIGSLAAVSISFGAWLGARYSTGAASRTVLDGEASEIRARKIARTALVIVSVLLVSRWIYAQLA